MTIHIPGSEPESIEMQLLKAKIRKDQAVEDYEALAEIARQTRSIRKEKYTDPSGIAELSVQPNRQWNKKKALESYGEEICTMQVDLVKAREVMTGAEFESYYIEGAPKIVVTMAKDV